MKLGQISFINFASQIASSVFGFIATIYLARTLGAGVLGTYFLVVAIVIWAKVVMFGGVQSALTKRLSEGEEPGAYLAAGTGLFLGLYAVLLVGLFLGRDLVNAYIGRAVALPIAVVLLATVLFMFVSGALQGQHRVHISGALQPVDTFSRSALQITAVLLGFGLIGLLTSYALASVIAGVVGAVFVTWKWDRPARRHVWSLFDYARYSWLGRLSSRTFSSMDTLVLGVFVAPDLIGVYEISWNLASLLAIFSLAIQQTLFPEISSVANDDRDRVVSLLDDAFAYAGLFLIPGLIGSVLIGDFVLRIYGSEFSVGHTVLVILVASRLAYAYGEQFLNALNGLDRPDLAFRINAVFFVTNISLNFALVSVYGWVGAAVATAVSALVTVAIGYRVLTRFITVSFPIREVSIQVLAAGPMAVMVGSGRLFLEPSEVTAVILVAVGAVTYFASLFLLSGRFRTTVVRNLPIEYGGS
ncbi:polysaccharide biosynthesis C-terminal domain-containing protein [Natrinema zhouii]|uniref:Polysaccharide biosynthesis C-terminal domain-containing protein n=1 Tax=Natrinema zhouii TaxID=1710539 RepID=A0A7D6GLB6_9EURY|nr:polysaccharide biosynthesis C-terminal domain-containing protein [Natrinema zhouii]QLK27059.1 polysaccharide biosynthesis C-terminal domain-containing protein [Natrinema zhouii]